MAGLSIEIKDRHIKDLIDFYIEKQRGLRLQITTLEREVKDISAIIMQLKQTSRSGSPTEIVQLPGQDIYSVKWPWVRKITFALEQVGTPLTTKEIVDLLTDYEPAFISERRKAIASVSSTLSVKSGENL